MINSRSLDDLDPRVKALAEKHIQLCAQEGIDLLIYCTYRDGEAQDALYAQGRKTPGPIVTFAKAGESAHNYRLAYDAVPLVNGKAAWSDDSKLFIAGAAGERAGLEWAGRWMGAMREKVHFQWTGGLTLKELQAGQFPA